MKFIGKKILCLALTLNLVNFFIFIVFNVCSFSFFKKKKPYFNNNVVYAQKEESANEGNNKDPNDAKDNQLTKTKKGLGSRLWNITKVAGSAIYNKLSGTKTPENINIPLLNQIKEEITAIVNTQEKIKALTQKDEILKNMLESDESYKKAEQQYKEVEKNLKENKFQNVSNLLNPSKSWWQSFKSFFPFLDNQTPQTLKEVYKTALDNLQKVQQVKEDLNNLQNPEDKQEKEKLWLSIKDKINNFWPSANADVALESLNTDPQEEIPAIRNFLNNHKFATKLLGWCLGEKSNDVSLIASNLTRRLAKYVGNEAKKEVTKEFADVKKTFPEKLKQGVKDNIFEVITVSIAFTSLVITFLYWFIIKKIKSKNHNAVKKFH